MRTRRACGFFLFAAGLCLFGSPCDTSDAPRAWGVAAAAERDRTVYRRPLGNDAETLDPARIQDVYSRSVAQQIFDGLVQFDQALGIAPALAQFWKASRDGLTWTFSLRPGVRFHHGREVTSEDVVYSLTRLVDPGVKSGAADLFVNIKGARAFLAGAADHVTGLRALDRYTVEVTLNDAYAPFVSQLAVGHAKIVPKDLAERGEAFGSQPVGTGPFKFLRWDRGREIVLAANPEYYDGAPRVSSLVYRVFPGEQADAMYEEFRKGNLEDSPIPTSDYRRVISARTHVYVKRPMISVRFYGFNTRMKPLDDRRVRQALMHAIDRDAIVQQVVLGRYTLARGIVPPGILGFNPHLAGYAYDPKKARDLLATAGYPQGRGLPPIHIWSGARRDEVVQEHLRITSDLQAVGIDAQVRYQTHWPTFSKLLAEGKLPVFLYAWYADVPDPDNFLLKLFESRSPRNFFGYSNAVVDDLLNHARGAGDSQRRVDLYRRAERLIMDDAPLIPMWHFTYERLFQPYVKNVEVSSLGDPYIPLRKVTLDKTP